jgi:hypothetical protein
MEDSTIIILTRAFQLFICIPIILAFRQLYKDVYDNESEAYKDPDSD